MLSERLRESLKSYFDFTADYEFAGYVFPLHAKFFQRNARYVLVKKAEIYAYANFEYLFLHRLDGALTKPEFDALAAAAVTHLDDLVQPNSEHMSSVVTFVVDCAEIDPQLAEEIRRFKYRKNYKWGFHGWADIKFIVVTRESGSFVESKSAKGSAAKLRIADVY